MLEALRRGATGFLAKILFGLLVISFAVWGIADVFRGWGQSALAKVGKVEITAEEFQQAMQTELNFIGMRSGQRLTMEQARQFGLDSRVLARLMGTAALDQHARELKLGISDQAIADAIRNDPSFQGSNGQFNRPAFENALRQLGLTEAGYIARRRADTVREQITESLVHGVTPPMPQIEALHRYVEETRAVAHFTVPTEKAGTIPEPDDAKLKAYYDANLRQFMTPEYRKIAVLALATDGVRKTVAVPEADIKADFEGRKGTFGTPERRKVVQVTFPDRAAADKALAEVKAGKDLVALAKALGRTEAEYDLGTIAKSDMLDKKIADAAFASPKGKVSDIVEGEYALVLLRIDEIESAKVRTYDDVKEEIRAKLAGERAVHRIEELHKVVEDGRAAGKTLKEIAEANRLEYRAIAAIDRAGKAPDGKPVPDMLDPARILGAAFGTGVNVDTDAVELPDGGFAWVNTLEVTPEKQKPFEEVKAEVRSRYLEAERRTALSELGQKLIDRINAGEAIEAVAKELGLTVATTKPFKRNTQTAEVPRTAIAFAFTVAKDKAGAVDAGEGKGRLVFKVAEVAVPAKPEGAMLERLKAELARQMQTDLIAEYVGAVQNRLGVTFNEKEMRRISGGDTQ